MFESDLGSVVFHHIPKTGGTSFGEFLARLLPSDQRSAAFNDVSLLQEIATGKRYALYMGHFSWASVYETMAGSRVLTLLREPISRSISQFKNLSDMPRIQQHWQEADDGALLNRILKSKDRWTLTEMMLHSEAVVRGHFCNVLTRSFLPFEVPHHQLKVDLYDEAWLRLAKYNLLNNVDWFGLLEDLPISLLMLCQWLGLPAMQELERKNESPEPYKTTSSEDELLRRNNLMDIELYNFAAVEFARRSQGITTELVNSAYADAMRQRTMKRRPHLAAARPYLALPISQVCVPSGSHGLEVSREHGCFRWLYSDKSAFYIAGPHVPRTFVLHTLLKLGDRRLEDLRLEIAGVAYEQILVAPTRAGTMLMFSNPASEHEVATSPWIVLRVSISGRDELISNQWGVSLPFLLPVISIEAAWC